MNLKHALLDEIILPETNSQSTWEIDGWKEFAFPFLLGWPIQQG